MLKTAICDQLGISYPVFSVGFCFMATPELAAAVSNAGACGVLAATRAPASFIHQEVRRTRDLTDKPFGINIILARAHE
jgi:NAD(P)H-dependent flavin oxidoreductase YrpB (nitropropane dioxygenase family)